MGRQEKRDQFASFPGQQRLQDAETSFSRDLNLLAFRDRLMPRLVYLVRIKDLRF